MKIEIGVRFDGVAEVEVPDHMDIDDAHLLAEKLALVRISVTFDNPDAPEDVAYQDYSDECSEKARETCDTDWDKSITENICGTWESVQRRCMRCNNLVNSEGYCVSKACPFSDHNQNCPAGWTGHPNHSDQTSCMCSG